MAANDFRNFNVKLDAFVAKVNIAPALVVKRVAFDLFGRIVRKTPIDTGRARASWTISTNVANRNITEVVTTAAVGTAPRAGTRGRVRRAIGQVIANIQTQNLARLDVKPGDKVIISNNVPYIVALEEG